DVHYDLSKVMFITTANLLDPIPPALRDRMEVIHVPGYTEEEKIERAETVLVLKQLDANGLTRTEDTELRTESQHSILNPQSSVLSIDLQFSEASLRQMTRNYTYEAGVRNLQRQIGANCRKVAGRVDGGRRFP